MGTIGPIVKSRTENKQLGFLTSRHIAVDLEYPNQKMFHPLPPSHGPGVYLGSVGRATTFVTDDLWYGIFAAANPGMYCSDLHRPAKSFQSRKNDIQYKFSLSTQLCICKCTISRCSLDISYENETGRSC